MKFVNILISALFASALIFSSAAFADAGVSTPILKSPNGGGNSDENGGGNGGGNEGKGKGNSGEVPSDS